jgi:predicted ATP-dependent protease
MKDVVLESRYVGKVEVVPVESLKDVLEVALVGNKKRGLIEKIAILLPNRDVISIEKPSPN